MASKTILGIDIGHDQIKLALVKGNTVKRTAVEKMPEGLMKGDHIVSVETLGELLRKTMRANRIRCRQAAVVLSGENVFYRQLSMPVMTAEQLVFNLPFEFRDYITEDYKNYIFDYAMISTVDEIMEKTEERQLESIYDDSEPQESVQMELLAVAMRRDLLEDLQLAFRKAGLRLTKAAPVISAYRALTHQMSVKNGYSDKEYCIVDLGYNSARFYVLSGDHFNTTRDLDRGVGMADDAIAEAYGVDIHIAHTYLESNYDNCQNKDCCKNVWDAISVELMRSINFYQFSNASSELEDIWLCGGGASIQALCNSLESNLKMRIHPVSELIPNKKTFDNQEALFVQAIGITQDL